MPAELTLRLVHREEVEEVLDEDVYVVEGDPAIIESQLKPLVDHLAVTHESQEAVILAFQDAPNQSGPYAVQMLRNAKARDELLAEFGALTAAEVATVIGSSAKNAASRASRLHQQHKIFRVPHGGKHLYPAFQFAPDSGQPLGIIHELIEGLRPTHTPWQIALWCVTPNVWLDNQRPVDLFQSTPDRAREAIRHEAEELDF